MKQTIIIAFVFSTCCSFLTTFPATTMAADAARVAGSLQVDGLCFSGDPSKTVITKPSDFPFPWTILGSDIYYMTGNVGIGTMSPSTKLEVNGTVKATLFSGDGSGLSNVTASSVTDGSIATTKIADGAVTDTQVSGMISANKLDLSAVQKKYGKVTVVAQSGGDYSSPVTAMEDVANWCGVPSSINPCMLKIMPGIYDLGSGTLYMQPYVDVEGSGEGVTTIASAGSKTTNPRKGIVNGANNAEIRFLSITNIATLGGVIGILNASTSPRMTNIAVLVSGNDQTYGVFNTDSSSPIMSNVNASASSGGIAYLCYGVSNQNHSSPLMTNVTAIAKGCVNNDGINNHISSSPIMNNVTAIAENGSYNRGVANLVDIMDYTGQSSPLMTNVTAIASGGTNSNIGVYSYVSTPIMTNVTAKATCLPSGLDCMGIYTTFSISQTMTNVTASASGGTNNYGVNNLSSSSLIMTNVTASASGGTNSYGVYNEESSFNGSTPLTRIHPTMTNVTASAKNGNNNYGMYETYQTSLTGQEGAITVDRSTFEGSTSSITGRKLKIGASKLIGGPINVSGAIACVGVYNGDTYTALNASCQ